MNVIMTGGTGFIGRNVVIELLKTGAEVTVLTSNPSVISDNPLVKTIYTTYKYDEWVLKLSGKNMIYFTI